MAGTTQNTSKQSPTTEEDIKCDKRIKVPSSCYLSVLESFREQVNQAAQPPDLSFLYDRLITDLTSQ